ncbi:phosphatase PAP2 family protein [Streptomyces sp. 7N604]|uniref:phosphatase PAP2 family protein n=1 Tax=Streptomyces sp. 7N604 TaxID=3457415 RepID=UPI003FD53E0C
MPHVRVVLPALCAVLFGLLTWQVVTGGPLRALDERAGRSIFRPHGWVLVAERAADLGNTQVALPVLGAAVCVSLWRGVRGGRDGVRRWWLPSLLAALAMAAVPAVVVPLKIWIGRPGPLGPAEDYGWYPSGHAATAAVAYGTAALLLTPALRRALARRLLGAAAVLLNLAVGTGLVLRAYHWPLDVVASWLLFGALLCALAGPVGSPVRGPAPRPPMSRIRGRSGPSL